MSSGSADDLRRPSCEGSARRTGQENDRSRGKPCSSWRYKRRAPGCEPHRQGSGWPRRTWPAWWFAASRSPDEPECPPRTSKLTPSTAWTYHRFERCPPGSGMHLSPRPEMRQFATRACRQPGCRIAVERLSRGGRRCFSAKSPRSIGSGGRTATLRQVDQARERCPGSRSEFGFRCCSWTAGSSRSRPLRVGVQRARRTDRRRGALRRPARRT